MENAMYIATYLAAAFAVGISSISAGMGEGYTAGYAIRGIMRQPKVSDSMLRNMLVSQAVTESAAIFGLVIALLLLFGGSIDINGGWQLVAALFGSGLSIGIGSLGPCLGSGYIGGMACQSLARQPRKSGSLTANMLIGQALAQTSAIFALLIALLLILSAPRGGDIGKTFALLAAGLCIGFGTLGPAIGVGYVGGKAVDSIGRFPDQTSLLVRNMFIGSAVSQSTAIYSMVVAFLLMFVV